MNYKGVIIKEGLQDKSVLNDDIHHYSNENLISQLRFLKIMEQGLNLVVCRIL